MTTTDALPTERLLNTEQLSEVTGIAAVTLRNWRINHNGPPYFKVGPTLVRYRLSEVEQWLNESRRTS